LRFTLKAFFQPLDDLGDGYFGFFDQFSDVNGVSKLIEAGFFAGPLKGTLLKLLVSFLTNLIVIKNNNPDKAGQAPRSAIVNYPHPPLVPFSGSIRQTLLSGVKPAVGVGK